MDIIENFQTINQEFEIFSINEIDTDFTLKILKNHLEQIMIFLLDNAIKFSTNEKVIQINVRHTDKQLTIEVKDYGAGYPERRITFCTQSLLSCG